MPDQITQPGGQNGTGAQQPSSIGQAVTQPSGQQQTAQQPQEPAWLSRLTDEAERKEAREGWLRDADYRRKTQEISDRQKSWETEKADYERRAKEWQTFQEQYQPFYQKLQSNWDRIAPILSGQQVPATQQPQHQDQTGQAFENWDILPPAEQAKRLAEHVNQTYVTQAFQQMQNAFNQQLAQREQQYQNYLNILTDAYGRKFQDPSLDLNTYMKKVLDIQLGRENPMELGYAAVTNDAKIKAMEEAAFKRGQEEAELKFKNSQITNGAISSPVIPKFGVKPQTREQVTESVRQAAISKGLPW